MCDVFVFRQSTTHACMLPHTCNKKNLPSATELLSPGGAVKEDTDTHITRSKLQA
jgi:hypothetical protein